MRTQPVINIAAALTAAILISAAVSAPALAGDVVFFYPVEAQPAPDAWRQTYDGWPVVRRGWGQDDRGGRTPCFDRYQGYDYFCAEYVPAYDRWGGFLGIMKQR
jgi:hypothetical protein